MTKKRILLIDDEHIIGKVINSLLTAENQFQVCVVNPCTEANLAQIIQDFQPSVVLVDDNAPYEIVAGVMETLLRVPLLRIVVLCSRESCVTVYSSQQLPVLELADFISIL